MVYLTVESKSWEWRSLWQTNLLFHLTVSKVDEQSWVTREVQLLSIPLLVSGGVMILGSWGCGIKVLRQAPLTVHCWPERPRLRLPRHHPSPVSLSHPHSLSSKINLFFFLKVGDKGDKSLQNFLVCDN